MWFQTFLENFLALPVWAFVVLGVLLAGGIVFLLLNKSQDRKAPAIALLVLFIIALSVIFALAIPAITPEEGSTTAAAFLYSSVFWSIMVAVLGVVALVLLLRRQTWTVPMLSTGALCVALAFVLSCLTLYRMPQGGSVTPASMLPILLFSWIYGPLPGMAAGMMDGMMQLIQGAYVVHPVQFLMDYILPFAALGLCGLFRKDKALPIGITVAVIARFIIHTLSGVIFFASYAPEGQSVLLYSMGYNASYLLPEFVICLIIVLLPRVQQTFVRLKHQALSAKA